MGNRGRPPKTAAQHKLEGTRRDVDGDRLDVAFGVGEPSKPAEVAIDDEASSLWDVAVASLPAGAKSKVDFAMLAGVCRWYSAWRRFDRMLESGEDSQGQPVDSYKTLIQSATAWKQFESAASKFGLSPAARASIKFSGAKEPKGKLAKYGVVG